jgi:hypothetical protein
MAVVYFLLYPVRMLCALSSAIETYIDSTSRNEDGEEGISGRKTTLPGDGFSSFNRTGANASGKR